MAINSKLENLVILTASVETSDQMGTSETVALGVFDDGVLMGRAMGLADAYYSDHRVAFRQTEVAGLNEMAPLRPVRR